MKCLPTDMGFVLSLAMARMSASSGNCKRVRGNWVELPGVTHGLSNPGAKFRTATEGLKGVFAAFETREPAEGGAAVACMSNQDNRFEKVVWIN